MSGVVETDKGYYVIRLDSEFDQKATDEKKDEIIGQRQQELYQKVCDEYTSDFKFDIDKKSGNRSNLIIISKQRRPQRQNRIRMH